MMRATERGVRSCLLLLALANCGTSSVSPDGSADVTSDAVAVDATVDAEPPDPLPSQPLPPRAAGVRAARTSTCDPMDPLRCLLPWPSNAFANMNAQTATGLSVRVEQAAVARQDNPAFLARADGFSPVSPIVTAFAGRIDPASAQQSIRLLRATGSMVSVPVQVEVVPSRSGGADESAIVAYPRAVLDPATDYVVVVLDTLRTMDGMRVPANPLVAAALGERAPQTGTEARLAAYHAPTIPVLRAAGIQPSQVLRVWDFTTRSRENALRTLQTLRTAALEAVEQNRVTVVVDRVETPNVPSVQLVVLGRLTNLPNFVNSAGHLERNAQGIPTPVGVHEAPFRVAIPRGTGNYRVVLYGHGTGGDYTDSSFDGPLTAQGAAKVGVRFVGLTEADTLTSFERLEHLLEGSDRLASTLAQSLGDATAIARALGGMLANTLSAPQVGGMANPAAGRRPELSHFMWAGGSLGGTMGLVYAHLDPSVEGAVLNVPGAAWTHFLQRSSLFTAVRLLLRPVYPTDLDVQVNGAAAQTVLDDVDGANWVDALATHHPALLIQQSMGDPILPNPGSAMVAIATRARQVGAVLDPVPGVEPAEQVMNAAGYTQFRVPRTITAPYSVHGFAVGDSPAGVAAREQLEAFVRSVWEGRPLITVPMVCRMNQPPNSCDFAGR